MVNFLDFIYDLTVTLQTCEIRTVKMKKKNKKKNKEKHFIHSYFTIKSKYNCPEN